MDSMITRLAIYFVLGGAIIAAITYFASIGKGFMAAFVATLPSTSIITFIFTYLEGGNQGVVSYAKGLLVFLPAWLGYVSVIIFTLEKIGIAKTLILGLAVFLVLALITHFIVQNWPG